MNEEQQLEQISDVQEKNSGLEQTQAQGTKEERTYSKEEVTDIVEKRLKREREKMEKQFSERINALEENIKMQAMSEDEKQQFEYDKRIKELETRENDLKAREEAYNKAQYKATIEKQLSERNLPLTLSDMMLNMNAEDALNKMNQLQADMNTQVNASIESRIKSSASTPVTPAEEAKPLTLEDIGKMSTQDVIKNKAEVNKILSEYYSNK